MRSYVQIDSISIDLTNSIDKSSVPGKCEHFSMRGYVSEICEKDWKLCWPFPIPDNYSESEYPPLLLPLDVPKLRRCQSYRQELASRGSHEDDRADLNCSNAALRSDTQQVPVPVTFEGKEIDLNNSTYLSGGNDHVPSNNEKEKEPEVADSRINHEIGVKDLNHQIISVSSPKIYGGMRQEGQTNEKGCEGKEVSCDVELDTSKLKCMDQSSTEICNGGKPVVADDQCQKETEKAFTVLGEGTMVTKEDNIVDHTTGLPPPNSVACHNSKSGNTDNLIKNELQDHHLGKSTGLPRKKPRKVRLLTDLLSGNGETKTEKITIHGSPSEDTSIPQGKVNFQGDLIKTAQSRKRKFIVDEEQMAETEFENVKENAGSVDIVLNNGSKDVLAGIVIPDAVKSNWCKPEIERSHTMGKKKNKKNQFVGDHLISVPQKGPQKQDQDNMDFTNEAYASKTTSKLAPAPVFTENGKSNFPLCATWTENESKFSKGKGKMLQGDKELPSFCCPKNGMLVEDSFAHKRAKVIPNMTVTVPVHSAEGSMNEKDLEEGLDLSLNSYLGTQAYNQKRIHQIENQLPFSFPFQEGTSKAHQFIRKDRESYVVGESIIPFKHVIDDISGERFHREEITGARDTENAAEALEQVGIFQRYGDQLADLVPQDGAEDDVPMEIVELMAKNQYERGLPDTENESCLKKSTIKGKTQMTVGNTVSGREEWRLMNEDQKDIPEGRHGKYGTFMRGENVRSRERNSVHCFSPLDGYQMNMKSVSKNHSLFETEVSQPQRKPSSVFRFPPMSSSQLGRPQNCKLNGITAECGFSDATLPSQGGCGPHGTILQQDDKASHIWGSLTVNQVPLGYDIFGNKVVSQSTSTKDMQNQNMKRDIDLNYINMNASDYEMLNRRRAPGSLSRMNAEYPFPCKTNGIEPHQNLRESQHLYSNETIPAMHLLNLMDASKQSGTPFNASVSAQMLKRPSYPGVSNAKLEIGTSKVPLVDSPKRPSSDYFGKSYSSDKQRGSLLGFPTFGASSSIQQDDKLIGTTDFNGRISSKSGMKDSSSSAMHNRGNTKQLIWTSLEKETSLQCQLDVHNTCGTLMPLRNSSGSNTCSTNKNPADLPEAWNKYMIKGEDLRFEKASFSRNSPDWLALHSGRQLKNLKPSKLKEHARH